MSIRATLVVLATTTLGVVGQAQDGRVYRYAVSGDFINVYWSNAEVSGWIQVGRCGDKTALQTCVTYSVSRSSDNTVVEEGSGTIPNDAGTFAQGSLELYAHTSGANFERTAGGGGIVSVKVQRDRWVWSEQTGSGQSHLRGGYLYRWNGTQRMSSGTVSGIALGWDFSQQDVQSGAEAGFSRYMQIQMQHGPSRP